MTDSPCRAATYRHRVSNHSCHRATHRVAAVALTAITLSACGAESGSNENAESATRNEPPPDASASFCDQIDGIEQSYELFTAMDELEPADMGARVDTAATLFDAVEPPAEISKDWSETARFVRLLDEAFAGKDLTSQQDLQEIEEESGEQILGAMMSVQTSAQNVGRYVQSECGIDLGVSNAASVPDACTLLDDEDVAVAFDGSVPKPEPRRYGPSASTCIWEDGDREVSVTIMSAKALRKDYLSKSQPLDVPVPGVPGGHAYMGVFGIGRFSTDGHTVSFIAGEQGGLVSVKLGEDGDQAAEIGLAGDLAGTIVDGLAS